MTTSVITNVVSELGCRQSIRCLAGAQQPSHGERVSGVRSPKRVRAVCRPLGWCAAVPVIAPSPLAFTGVKGRRARTRWAVCRPQAYLPKISRISAPHSAPPNPRYLVSMLVGRELAGRSAVRRLRSLMASRRVGRRRDAVQLKRWATRRGSGRSHMSAHDVSAHGSGRDIYDISVARLRDMSARLRPRPSRGDQRPRPAADTRAFLRRERPPPATSTRRSRGPRLMGPRSPGVLTRTRRLQRYFGCACPSPPPKPRSSRLQARISREGSAAILAAVFVPADIYACMPAEAATVIATAGADCMPAEAFGVSSPQQSSHRGPRQPESFSPRPAARPVQGLLSAARGASPASTRARGGLEEAERAAAFCCAVCLASPGEHACPKYRPLRCAARVRAAVLVLLPALNLGQARAAAGGSPDGWASSPAHSRINYTHSLTIPPSPRCLPVRRGCVRAPARTMRLWASGRQIRGSCRKFVSRVWRTSATAK
jgi:hypothetical protein